MSVSQTNRIEYKGTITHQDFNGTCYTLFPDKEYITFDDFDQAKHFIDVWKETECQDIME